MRRQQAVLVALARQVDPISLLPKLPELLDIAGRHLWTTIESTDIVGLAALATSVDTDAITTVRFVPPRYPAHLTTRGIDAIRSVVRSVFASPAPAAPSHPSHQLTCP
jgi:hypothetical protein